MATQQTLDGNSEPTEIGDENDFYETPSWAVEKLVRWLPPGPSRAIDSWHVVDPGCGRGKLVVAAHQHGLPIASATGYEIHAGRAESTRVAWQDLPFQSWVLGLDFLEYGVALNPDEERNETVRRLVLMNPPYSKPRKTIGREFVQKAIEVASPYGVVAALLPLSFAETEPRKELIHDKHSSRLLAFGKRPGFSGEYSTGKMAYAWFIFDLLAPMNDWRCI